MTQKTILQKLLFLDEETTGRDKAVHDIWQLAMIVDIFDRDTVELEQKMAPLNPDCFEIKALELNNKSITELKDYPDARGQLVIMKNFMQKFVSPYNTMDKFIIVGYRVEFDKNFLRSHFFKLGDKYFGSWFSNYYIDVYAWTQALFALKRFPGAANCKLSTIAEHMGIEHDAHDAMSDIRATREIFYRIVRPSLFIGWDQI